MKTVGKVDMSKIRLLADRICYVHEGQDGLRIRAGLLASDGTYWDRYDQQAMKLAPSVFRPEPEPEKPKQLVMF